MINLLLSDFSMFVGEEHQQRQEYEQKVTRADVLFRHPMKDNRGRVYLSDQYFTFKVRRGKNFWMNFSIPYRRIEK